MSALDLLFELGTEELPPRALPSLSTALTEGVALGLDAAGIPHGRVHGFATPRRLAVRSRQGSTASTSMVVTDICYRSSTRRTPTGELTVGAVTPTGAAV